MPTFRERLWPPLRWWLLSALGVATVSVILASALPGPVAAAVGAALLAAVGGALTTYAAAVEVGEDGLRAGSARLPWTAVGRVEPLDRAGAAYLRGQGADPSAYLLLRGYISTAVRVAVVDPSDVTPYWYVSTRRPAELAAALASAGRTSSGEPPS